MLQGMYICIYTYMLHDMYIHIHDTVQGLYIYAHSTGYVYTISFFSTDDSHRRITTLVSKFFGEFNQLWNIYIKYDPSIPLRINCMANLPVHPSICLCSGSTTVQQCINCTQTTHTQMCVQVSAQ